ncbi:MAG: hypothetical protein U0457_17660 [Candidatus Sericytochromatia bacterium]
MNIKKGIVAFSLFFVGVMQPAFSVPSSFELVAESNVTAQGKKISFNTKMSYSDKKMRMDNDIVTTEKMPAGMNKSIMILDQSKNIAYTLLPSQKQAMKIDMEMMKKMGGANNNMNMSTSFMENPEKTKEQLKKMGGKMVGAETVLGHMCDIWTATQDIPMGNKGEKEKADVKIWLASKLGIPLKMIITSKKQGEIMNMKAKSVKTDVKFDSSLFEVPSNYQVTDMQKMLEQMKKVKQ